MQKHKAEKYLVPLSDVHNDHVKELLDAKNLNHTECVMFRTVSNDLTEQEVKDFDYDMLLFFSPTGFPTHLDLQDQGRFFVGYYHQRQDFFTKKETDNN